MLVYMCVVCMLCVLCVLCMLCVCWVYMCVPLYIGLCILCVCVCWVCAVCMSVCVYGQGGDEAFGNLRVEKQQHVPKQTV